MIRFLEACRKNGNRETLLKIPQVWDSHPWPKSHYGDHLLYGEDHRAFGRRCVKKRLSLVADAPFTT